MPTIGRSPGVIAVPALSDEETRERKAGLDEAYSLHGAILGHLRAAIPHLAAAERDAQKLDRLAGTYPAHRAVRLGRRMATSLLKEFTSRLAHLAQSTVVGAMKVASRDREETETLILDPELLR